MNRNGKIARAITAGLMMLTIGAGISACSPNPDKEASATKSAAPTATATPTPTPTPIDEPVELDKTVDSFFAQVKADTASYEAYVKAADQAGVTKEKADAALREHFAKSIEYIQPGTLSDQDVTSLMGVFAALYLSDPQASISGDPEDYTVTGITAKVYAADLTVILKGAELPTPEGQKGGLLELTKVDGQWMISAFSK